jgi:hypothetical protein
MYASRVYLNTYWNTWVALVELPDKTTIVVGESYETQREAQTAVKTWILARQLEATHQVIQAARIAARDVYPMTSQGLASHTALVKALEVYDKWY